MIPKNSNPSSKNTQRGVFEFVIPRLLSTIAQTNVWVGYGVATEEQLTELDNEYNGIMQYEAAKEAFLVLRLSGQLDPYDYEFKRLTMV